MPSALITAMRAVADTRAEAVAASDALKLKRDQFALENAALIAHEAATKAAVIEAEANAKALIAVHYAQTKNTAPVAGAAVKLFKTIRYDAARALAWAKETKLALLPESLDVKAFEKIASVTDLDFVTRDSEPRVQLAKELNATDYLTTDGLPLEVAGADLDFDMSDRPGVTHG